ncbi:hypothetical protein GCM10010191_68540 [Actinomadura vinacea]|uniref:Uncharacterized protein n=1 Tax=Actinomadura vinacea TaxID=115336 RepID=A0ABN3JZL3_9ACTN
MGLDFPYGLSTMCYIEVRSDGTVTHGRDAGTYQRARDGESRLFAVWPGKWKSDLFAIDDLDQYAKAFGIVHDEERTGLSEHAHEVRWAIDRFAGDSAGAWIGINVWLDCGCEIRDLRTFAAQMREQQGWDIATSRGWGSSTSGDGKVREYSVRARRNSLK